MTASGPISALRRAKLASGKSKMPRIPLIPLDAFEPDDRAGLDDLIAPGADATIFQAMAHRPAIMRTAMAHLRALLAPSALPADLKALIAVRVALINHCQY